MGRSGDLLCSQFMVVLDVRIVNVALSQMRASLGLSMRASSEAGPDHVWRAEKRQSGTTWIPNVIAVAGSNGASPIGTVIDSVLAACSTNNCSNPAGTKPW